MRFGFQILLLGIISVCAWRRASTTEVRGAAIMALMLAASPVYAAISEVAGRMTQLDVGYFVIDASILVLMLHLALTSQKWWPLWLASAQLIAMLSHVVRMLDADYAPLAYALMMRSPSWIQLLILLLGVLSSMRWKAHPQPS
jgi:hypothetical protein